MSGQLITRAQNTWCPGCGNFAIQHALKAVLEHLFEDEGYPPENVVLVTGIGCHGKMADYLNINTFYAIHGRTIPVATGIKCADPDLAVICCAGDGDAYAEGLDHLIFAAKRNVDITLIVHNNRVYGLTTGQYTPTSPLALMLASGAGFVARTFTRRLEHLRETLQQGILHKGFSFIDVLQICASFFDMTEHYEKYVYIPEGHDTADFDAAWRIAREWDYDTDAPIALGTLFESARPRFEDAFSREHQSGDERAAAIRRLLDGRV
jgi:2-oxoglutarate ferredoxin oxidoreductase subunit beta